MKRMLLLGLFFVLVAAPARALLPSDLKQDLSPLTALVIGLNGNQIILDKGRAQGVRLGDLFTIYRKGQPVIHPQTKKVLGYLKKPVALAEVIQVEENFATARLLSRQENFPVPTPAIRYGDLKILVLSASPNLADTYLPELESLLTRSRLLYEPRRTLGSLSPAGLRQEKINLVFYLEPGALRIYDPNLNLIRTYTLPRIATPRPTPTPPSAPATRGVPASQAAPSPAPPRTAAYTRYPYSTLTYALPQAPRFRRVGRLPQIVAHLEIGDLNGDGKPEVVYLTPEALYIAEYRGRLLARYQFRGFGQVLTFSLGPSGWIALDIYQKGRGMVSELLRFDGRNLVPEIRPINLILAFMDFNGDGINDTLVGQTFSQEDFFGSEVYILGRKGRKIIYQKKLVVPAGFRLIGSTFADLDGDGYLETIFINRGHKLEVYRYTQKLWTSSRKVGGSLYGIQVRVGPYKQTYTQTIPAEVNFLVRDLNGDGRKEVLLVSNHSAHHDLLPGIPAYTAGEVMVLRYSAAGFELLPFSGQFEAPVQGLGILGSELLVALTRGNPFTQEGESYLVAMPLVSPGHFRAYGPRGGGPAIP